MHEKPSVISRETLTDNNQLAYQKDKQTGMFERLPQDFIVVYQDGQLLGMVRNWALVSTLVPGKTNCFTERLSDDRGTASEALLDVPVPDFLKNE